MKRVMFPSLDEWGKNGGARAEIGTALVTVKMGHP
jgi:hypothetical protein